MSRARSIVSGRSEPGFLQCSCFASRLMIFWPRFESFFALSVAVSLWPFETTRGFGPLSSVFLPWFEGAWPDSDSLRRFPHCF